VPGCRRLIRMTAARFVLTLTAAAALLAGVSSAGAVGTLAPPRPTGLKAFLLTTSEPAAHVFPRTPSFAWKPVKGALRYEFQLATTMSFNDGSVVWSNVNAKTKATSRGESDGSDTPPTKQTLPRTLRDLRAPTIALDVALPWITGEPYSLYARVRAVSRDGASRWSASYGFNVRWPDVQAAPLNVSGLLRWTPVEGATGYDVWISGQRRSILTRSNVLDVRDLYTFHQSPEWTRTVVWRVRAVRHLYGKTANGLPAVSHGPWSPIYVTHNPDFGFGGPLRLTTAVSDVQTTGADGRQHRLMPAFAWSGTDGTTSGVAHSGSPELWRVYVATDRDCVNVVFRGAAVGSPAYAPRATGTLKMPHDASTLAKARTEVLDLGAEGEALTLDGDNIMPTESAKVTGTGTDMKVELSKTDLWDNAFTNGGYYWTVVPVVMEKKDAADGGSSGGFLYRDLELPQDACRSGRVMRFGKASDRVITAGNAPFATGMSPRGLLVSARRLAPTFYGTPLVAWQPALGAEEYQVEWSRSGYPWKRLGSLKTAATSALLPLTPGRWYYRVRGLNRDAVSKPEMAWSVPMRIDIAKPVFAIARSGR
jgi:hypothetical protein